MPGDSDLSEASAPRRRLLVGLGNPGKKYRATRHNVGFEVAATLARRYAREKPRQRFEGELVEATVAGHRMLLLCPLTYMNRSGRSVRQAKDFFKLPDDAILIICDDFSLPLGRLRIRGKGSAGGQKGLQDIISQLGSQEIPRLRIGIGEPPPRWDASDFVLSRFSRDEAAEIEVAVERAADAAVAWVSRGLDECMAEFNRR